MKGRKPDLRLVEEQAEIVDASKVDTDLAPPGHIPEAMHDEWRTVAADLAERKLLNDAMRGSLDAYVMTLWTMRQAQAALDKHGVLVDAGNGILKQNPAASMLGKARDASIRLATELGLTPASRSRKTMQPPKDDKDGGQFSLLDI